MVSKKAKRLVDLSQQDCYFADPTASSSYAETVIPHHVGGKGKGLVVSSKGVGNENALQDQNDFVLAKKLLKEAWLLLNVPLE